MTPSLKFRYRRLAALTLALLALSACGGSAEESAAPSPLISARSYPSAHGVGEAAQVQLLRYRMPAVRGGSTEANSLLFIPKGTMPVEGWPLLVWAHGTTGIADACAPSRDFANDQDQPMVRALVAAGFAVLAPDYEGLDAPGPHPYLNHASQGRSITEAVRAAHRLSTLRLRKAWAVIGHSQGGFAALAAAEWAHELPADLPLRATVALAPASDVTEMAAELRGQIDALNALMSTHAEALSAEALAAVRARIAELSFFLAHNAAMVAHGLRAGESALPLDRLLASGFVPVAEQAAQDPDCKRFEAAVINDATRHLQTGGALRDWPTLRPDAFTQTEVVQALARQRLGQRRPMGELLIVQGTEDTQTPIESARAQAARLKAMGAALEFVEIEEGDHGSITETELARAIAFIRQRI